MAAHRKPTALLAFTGAFKHDPARGRARTDEPVPGGPIGEPPAGMPPEVEACWREIVATCPSGVLGDCDTFSVEIAAHLLYELRNGGAIQVSDKLRLALAALGMSPTARSKVRVTFAGEGGEVAAPDPSVAPSSFSAC